MRTDKQFLKSITLTALLFAGFSAGSIAQDTTTVDKPETKAPVILATTPADGAMNVNQNSAIEITFSSEMDATSINSTTILLQADTSREEYGEMQQDLISNDLTNEKSDKSRHYSKSAVKGTISYANKTAVFTPDEELKEGTTYTVTVTTGVKNSENIALENDQKWSFTTSDRSDSKYTDKQNTKQGMKETKQGMKETKQRMKETEEKSMYDKSTNKMKSIDLGKAGQFVILAKKDVNNESGSKITGHIGEGSEENNMKNEKASKQSNTDQKSVMQSEQSDTTSSPNVTEAIEVLASTYSDVLKHQPDELTTHNTDKFHHDPVLKPGVHEWDSSIQITEDVTLSGSEEDVWVFKTNNNLTVDENVVFTLTDGARADNVYWYVEGEVSIGKNAKFEGIILSMNDITLGKGAIVNGRMFSQTSITLDDNTITEPRSMAGQTSSKNK